MATETKPYIFFYGRCAEALAFYSSVFGGGADIDTFGTEGVITLP